MLLALLLATADAGPPPAVLHVPKSVIRARSGDDEDDRTPLSPFATPEILQALGPLKPQVGAWAEYAVRTKGKPDERIRVSILPPTLDGGRFWMEVATGDETALPSAVKLLVRGDPSRP